MLPAGGRRGGGAPLNRLLVAMAERAAVGQNQSDDQQKSDDRGDDQQQNVSAQNQDGEPPGNFLLHGQDKERGREQKLVRDRVEVGAQRRFLVKRTGEIAVDRVRESNENENDNGPVVFFIENKNEKERQEAKAEQCDLVGNRPDAGFHWFKNIADQANWAR